MNLAAAAAGGRFGVVPPGPGMKRCVFSPLPCCGAAHLKIPEGFELVNMVAKLAKLATNMVAKNDANLALPPRFRQVLIEWP
ncbi:hypothetical protein TNCV_4713901 [Trichonephila clavipes]|nr:hypothetical protein TNCV_4713901 [Trichonephila clavipes]